MRRNEGYKAAIDKIAEGCYGAATWIAGNAVRECYEDDVQCSLTSVQGTRCRWVKGHDGQCNQAASQAAEW